MARCSKITTTTGTVTATLLAGGSASFFYGLCAVSAEAAVWYVKLYWEGTGVQTPTAANQQVATTLPSAGTTAASLTIPIPAAGLALATSPVPINNGARIWYWISATPGDGAQTALTTGGDLVTMIYD
jgi:hypothetical protein